MFKVNKLKYVVFIFNFEQVNADWVLFGEILYANTNFKVN